MSETQDSVEKKLSTQLTRREVDTDTWNALQNTIFPGAHPASILMAIDYCRARKLDILKKPVHIVPMPYKDGRDWKSRDVVMPGINEVRTTAMRTGQYAGADKPEWGCVIEVLGVKVPESCTYTVYRFMHGQKVPFPATVYFEEACGTTKDWDNKDKSGNAPPKLNAMWTRRPRGQLEKCAEAAALRKAFPEEIGNEYVPEEMQMLADVNVESAGRTIEPGTNRTSAAADALKNKLGITDKSGDKNPLSDLAGAQIQGDNTVTSTANARGEVEAGNKTREAEWQDPKAGGPLNNRRNEGRYNVESAVAALRASTSIEALDQTFQMIQDDYDFSARELPVDIEANYGDIKESFEQGQRT